MLWARKILVLPEHTTGFYPITRDVQEAFPELKQVKVGLIHLFLQHTSAALTINENADGDVLADLGTSLESIAPESADYRHTIEGRDDMPGHIKSSLVGVSLSIPIEDGKLMLGTWQDVYLCEYRHEPHCRSVVLTLQGSME